MEFLENMIGFCVGLWATLILNGRRSLAVISDAPFMYGNVMIFTVSSGSLILLSVCALLCILFIVLL